jgi:trans-aconitate 2-methyltransferase
LKPEFGERVSFLSADVGNLLAEHPELAGAFDGIFSTATFHWVLDHDQLFANLFQALRPGGWMHAQCGGGSNLGRLLERFRVLGDTAELRPFLANAPSPWTYARDSETSERLRRAGFEDVETSLEPAPAVFKNSDSFVEFVESVILRAYLPRIPDERLRRGLMDQLALQAANDTPPFELDYWRLNLRATRPR